MSKRTTHQNRTNRRLSLENLETRQLMAVDTVKLEGRVLNITMDDNGGNVRSYSSGNMIVVEDNEPGGFYLTKPTWKYPKSSVDRIEFHGGNQNDSFDNDAFVPVTAFGGDGNDYLNGGNAADILYGGEGKDELTGMGGNDRLYGGDGKDILRGGNDHDSLFGGGEQSADELWGGAGRDRFLTQGTDVIKDGSGLDRRDGDDAQIQFVDRDESWSNKEIQVVDEAFAQLFDARGDNRLLKDTRTGAPLTFYQSDLTDASGRNTVKYTTKGCWVEGPFWDRREVCDYRSRFDRREITIDEWDASNASQNQAKINTVIHEIGHNFQGTQLNSTVWNKFLALSGWQQNPKSKTGLFEGQNFSSGKKNSDGWYRNTNDRARFASNYAGTNPNEDWAETWELYFQQGRSTKAPGQNSVLESKLKLVAEMVRLA